MPTGYFDFSPRARTIYQQVLSLRFTEARSGLDVLRREEADNRIIGLLENYLDFLTVLVDDNRQGYESFVKRTGPRIAGIAHGDSRSPYYLYAQAEIRLQGAVLRGRYGDYWSCFNEIRKAYALLRENQRRYPGFMPNRKSLGILHTLIGNIPDEYRWGLNVLGGLSGTIEQGMAELESVLSYARRHDFVFEAETRLAYSFLLLHVENKKETAWQTLSAGAAAAQTTPLATFALANLAMRTGRNDEAIRLLETCPAGVAFHPFPYRFYLLGIAKLNRLDPDANQALETFVQTFSGESGLKEACQKLAWYQLVTGNEKGYRYWMAQVRVKGNDRSEPDKAALREARSGEMPDARLTRARLLFDGGYYARAYELLRNNAAAYTGAGKSAAEYSYRLGRIAQELGKTEEALRLYAQTMAAGAGKPWYFACNAALQMGLLYEQQNVFAKARTAFNRCLDLKPEDYAASLHARAKAGLARLKGR